MNKNIYTTNLCGRKLYSEEDGIKKFFGKIVADFSFESEEIKGLFSISRDTVVVITDKKLRSGWIFSSLREKEILILKGIPFDANTRGWYVNKSMIGSCYFLEEKKTMVMTNE